MILRYNKTMILYKKVLVCLTLILVTATCLARTRSDIDSDIKAEQTKITVIKEACAAQKTVGATQVAPTAAEIEACEAGKKSEIESIEKKIADLNLERAAVLAQTNITAAETKQQELATAVTTACGANGEKATEAACTSARDALTVQEGVVTNLKTQQAENDKARRIEQAAAEEKRVESAKEAIRSLTAKTSQFDLGTYTSVGNESKLNLSGEGGANDDKNVISRVIFLIASIVGTLAILLYVIAAYYLIFSMGDENTFNKGKTIVEYTTIGLVIVFAAYMIIQFAISIVAF